MGNLKTDSSWVSLWVNVACPRSSRFKDSSFSAKSGADAFFNFLEGARE